MAVTEDVQRVANLEDLRINYGLRELVTLVLGCGVALGTREQMVYALGTLIASRVPAVEPAEHGFKWGTIRFVIDEPGTPLPQIMFGDTEEAV